MHNPLPVCVLKSQKRCVRLQKQPLIPIHQLDCLRLSSWAFKRQQTSNFTPSLLTIISSTHSSPPLQLQSAHLLMSARMPSLSTMEAAELHADVPLSSPKRHGTPPDASPSSTSHIPQPLVNLSRKQVCSTLHPRSLAQRFVWLHSHASAGAHGGQHRRSHSAARARRRAAQNIPNEGICPSAADGSVGVA